MATSSAMADFAKMPTEKKVLVFVAIGLLLGLVYWKLVYASLTEQLETAQADHREHQHLGLGRHPREVGHCAGARHQYATFPVIVNL